MIVAGPNRATRVWLVICPRGLGLVVRVESSRCGRGCIVGGGMTLLCWRIAFTDNYLTMRNVSIGKQVMVVVRLVQA